MTSTFTVATLTLTGTDGVGVGQFGLSDVDGWFAPVDSDGALNERAAANLTGKHEYLPSKTFAVSGFYLGADRAAVRAAMSQLAALRQATLVRAAYDEDGAETSRRAVVSAVEITQRPGGLPRFDFAIDFIAKDPRRYGALSTSAAITGTTASVTNNGTAPSPLTLDITRNADTQTITVPGASATFSLPLATGSLLRLDGERMDYYLDGTRPLGMQSLQWPTVDPGETVVVTVTGASSWTVGVRDAWW